MARSRKRRPTKSQIPDFGALRRRVADIANESGLDELETYADEARDDFVDKIERQAFDSFRVILYPESGTNLSPDWLARKERAGADLRTMIATEHYKESIGVHRSSARSKKAQRKRKNRGRGATLRIGFHHLAKARDLNGKVVDITLNRVAITQEKGSVKARIPARPHWRPHLDAMRSKAPATRKRIKRRIKADLKQQLRGKAVVR